MRLSSPSPATSSLLPPAAASDQSGADRMCSARKVGETEPWTQFSLSQFLISHLFFRILASQDEACVGADSQNNYLPKKFSAQLIGSRVRPFAAFLSASCGAFGPARCCVAAPELSSQSWDQGAETAWRISLRGATWLVPTKKAWLCPWDVELLPVGEQLLGNQHDGQRKVCTVDCNEKPIMFCH